MEDDELDKLLSNYRRARRIYCDIHEETETMGKSLRSISHWLWGKDHRSAGRAKIKPLNEVQIAKIGDMPNASEIVKHMLKWAIARENLLKAWRAVPIEHHNDMRTLPVSLDDERP